MSTQLTRKSDYIFYILPILKFSNKAKAIFLYRKEWKRILSMNDYDVCFYTDGFKMVCGVGESIYLREL